MNMTNNDIVNNINNMTDNKNKMNKTNILYNNNNL